MAISIGDALLKVGIDKKDFDTGMTSIGQQIEKHRKAIGIAMAASGAAIIGGLAGTMKMAAEEEAGIQKLRIAMQNVGISYDENRESLEKLINTQQQKTAVADSAQREALSQLITMTGDLGQSQDLLSLAMDISAGTGKDLTSVTSTLGYALAGNWGMVNRMIPALAEVESEEEKWAFLREAFAGQAEAYGQTLEGQMQLLENNVSDVGEALGSVLIPLVTDLFHKIMPVVESMKEWIAANPGLTKAILIATGVLGGLLLGLGTLTLILPGLIAALPILGMAFHAALGPIGLITLAIAALIAIGIAVWKNWDTIKAKAIEVWEKIKTFFVNIWEKIKIVFQNNWDKILAILFPSIGLPILIARNWDTIKEYIADLWDKVTKIIEDWWDNMKSFLRKINPWEWMKRGWEKLKQGIGGILDSIFGHSDVENWTAGLKDYLSNVDLSQAGKNMFDTFGQGVNESLRKVSDDVKDWADKQRLPAEEAYPGMGEVGTIPFSELTPEQRTEGIRKGGHFWAPTEEDKRAIREFFEPGLKHGGIVTHPITTRIAERGPEAVIPLDRFEKPKTINVYVELDGREIARAIGQPMVDIIRLRAGLHV